MEGNQNDITNERVRGTYQWLPVIGLVMLGLIWLWGSVIVPGGRQTKSGGGVSDSNGNDTELSGVLRLSGSSSMEKLTSVAAEGFMDKYPNVTVTVEYIGSSAGIEAVLNGSADIGNSSRFLKEEEREKGAVGHVVAMDGIAICVDPANSVEELTLAQVAEIYTGKIINWSELGGEELPIVVIGHEAGSGTRASFESLLGIEDVCTYGNELNSGGAVMARVAMTPGAVGYISFDIVNDLVNTVSIDGVEPRAENVKDGSYPLCRPFVMVTKGDSEKENRLVRAWFTYLESLR